MAAGITPQSGLLEINGRLKVNEAINPNDVLTRNSLGKKSEKSFFANQAINTISGTTPIVVAIDAARIALIDRVAIAINDRGLDCFVNCSLVCTSGQG